MFSETPLHKVPILPSTSTLQHTHTHTRAHTHTPPTHTRAHHKHTTQALHTSTTRTHTPHTRTHTPGCSTRDLPLFTPSPCLPHVHTQRSHLLPLWRGAAAAADVQAARRRVGTRVRVAVTNPRVNCSENVLRSASVPQQRRVFAHGAKLFELN